MHLLRRYILAALFLLPMLQVSLAQPNAKPKDWLGVPGPVMFDQKAYQLVWSSHPADHFFKQEYLVKGENLEKFTTMLMLDVITGDQDLKTVVGQKMAELKKMKEGNPMVNYDLIQNPTTGEYMLDFLLTANAANGDISIIERNVYRYKLFTDKNGKRGVLLFGLSTRAYAPAVDRFLAGLKASKQGLVNKVAAYKMPEILVGGK